MCFPDSNAEMTSPDRVSAFVFCVFISYLSISSVYFFLNCWILRHVHSFNRALHSLARIWVETKLFCILRKTYFFLINLPEIRDRINSVDWTLAYKAKVGRTSRIKRGRCLQQLLRFPLEVTPNSVAPTQRTSVVFMYPSALLICENMEPQHYNWK